MVGRRYTELSNRIMTEGELREPTLKDGMTNATAHP
jgi:hypothetical protein